MHINSSYGCTHHIREKRKAGNAHPLGAASVKTNEQEWSQRGGCVLCEKTQRTVIPVPEIYILFWPRAPGTHMVYSHTGRRNTIQSKQINVRLLSPQQSHYEKVTSSLNEYACLSVITRTHAIHRRKKTRDKVSLERTNSTCVWLLGLIHAAETSRWHGRRIKQGEKAQSGVSSIQYT